MDAIRHSQHGVPVLGVQPRVLEISQGEPPDRSWPADVATSSCCTNVLQVRAASVRGFMHRARHGPRQDAFAVRQSDAGSVILVVCDGVGSLPTSEIAAQLICDSLPSLFLESGNWAEAIAKVSEQVDAADQAERQIRGELEATMASTVVACHVGATTEGLLSVSYACVGDAELWSLQEGQWRPLVGAEHDSDGFYATKTKALPSSDPSVLTGQAELQAGALFLFTDGVSVPLSMGADVQETLAQWWSEPPDPFTFASQVGFARRGFMDDRTAIGVWLSAPSDAPANPDGSDPDAVAAGTEGAP